MALWGRGGEGSNAIPGRALDKRIHEETLQQECAWEGGGGAHSRVQIKMPCPNGSGRSKRQTRSRGHGAWGGARGEVCPGASARVYKGRVSPPLEIMAVIFQLILLEL